jgi:hypothetical protein
MGSSLGVADNASRKAATRTHNKLIWRIVFIHLTSNTYPSSMQNRERCNIRYRLEHQRRTLRLLVTTILVSLFFMH